MKLINYFILITFILGVFSSCDKDNDDDIEPPPPPPVTTGVIKGLVTDAVTGNGLDEVRIFIFDANTNAPTDSSLVTDSLGNYEVIVNPGTYYLKLFKQGYQSIPPRGISALPVTVIKEDSLENNYQMTKSKVTDGGWITGVVTAMDSPQAGVLVVAYDGNNGYSSVSDGEGKYFIYNVPPASYTLKGWIAGYNSDETNVTVSSLTETPDNNITLTEDATGSVEGQITFLATNNIEIDVSLTHPGTGESIPGLSTYTTGQNYSISDVPDGTYLARATFENDTKVIDPDWVVKNGEPFVTVSGATVTKNFSVTGAIQLVSPTNDSTTTQPVEISSTAPTFSWMPYSSTSEYIIEVMDANGNVIWGGFDSNWTVKNVIIPKAQNSIDFNFDGSATGTLEAGMVYRWRIYASKDDAKEPLGWKLISASEDQLGLIRIAQ